MAEQQPVRTYWFIDPQGDERSNITLRRMLPPENACEDMLCEDKGSDKVVRKVRRNLWLCTNWEFVRNFTTNAKHNEMKYAIYNREGEKGPIRRWIFSSKRPGAYRRKGGRHAGNTMAH